MIRPSRSRSYDASRFRAASSSRRPSRAVAVGVDGPEQHLAPIGNPEYHLIQRRFLQHVDRSVQLRLRDLAVGVPVHQGEEALEGLPAAHVILAEGIVRPLGEGHEQRPIELARAGAVSGRIRGAEVDPAVTQVQGRQRVVHSADSHTRHARAIVARSGDDLNPEVPRDARPEPDHERDGRLECVEVRAHLVCIEQLVVVTVIRGEDVRVQADLRAAQPMVGGVFVPLAPVTS